MHSLPYRDASMLVIAAMRRSHPEELERAREWEKIATDLGIPITVNPALAEKRKKDALAKVHADLFGDDD